MRSDSVSDSSSVSATQAITVSVDGTGGIHCVPDPAVVQHPNTLLQFTLVTTGYKFASTGAIVISTPSTSFPTASQTVKPTFAVIMDACSVNGDFDYTVNLVAVATGEPLSVDPVIRNTSLQAD